MLLDGSEFDGLLDDLNNEIEKIKELFTDKKKQCNMEK